jgi:hypothetical protein
MPPYGFLNDIWTFKDKEIYIYSRIDKKNITANYIEGNGEIIVTPSGGNIQIIKAVFNNWGHLVLDTGNEKIKLKLISKQTETIHGIPLKVVLLKLRTEE